MVFFSNFYDVFFLTFTVNTNEELTPQSLNNITMRALHNFAKIIHIVNNFFNRQNELKLNENNYLKIILFFKEGEEKTM